MKLWTRQFELDNRGVGDGRREEMSTNTWAKRPNYDGRIHERSLFLESTALTGNSATWGRRQGQPFLAWRRLLQGGTTTLQLSRRKQDAPLMRGRVIHRRIEATDIKRPCTKVARPYHLVPDSTTVFLHHHGEAQQQHREAGRTRRK